MKYAALIELSLTHSYYADGRCPDFTIEASADTARLLASCRWLLQPGPSGVRALSPLDATGAPFLPLPAGSVLRFYLRLRNPDFALFTDLTGMTLERSLPAPLFSNQASMTSSLLKLVTDTTGRAARPQGVFAEVVIVPGAMTGQRASYSVAFTARQMRWAYYCLTDAAADDLQIVNAAPTGVDEDLRFSVTNRTDLTGSPDAADAFAVQLASRSSELRIVRFLSDAQVPLRQKPRKYLELWRADERLTGPLPNPTPRDAVRDDVLAQIIKYRTQPLLTQ